MTGVGIRKRVWLSGFWLLGLGLGGAVWGQVPGWNIAGSAPQDYSFSRVEGVSSSGKGSARIAAKASVNPAGFGTLMQTISAETYRGGRWRLSGYLKTDGVARAQMWMRIDGAERAMLGFDNMDSRPVIGTTNWKRYEIVLDVPTEAMAVAFGFFLAGTGTVWGDDFRLEKVDASTPLTSTGGGMPRSPQNMGFE